MTTMTDSDPASSGRVPGVRPLRRSRGDRMISGVAGGLGEYFIVDAVIFRVLFAVLSFFGGVGLLLYGMAWLLILEPQEADSALDRTIAQLRRRQVPPWLVIIGGAIVLWIAWFSWWAPGPTFPALMLIAILTLVLLNRLGRGTLPIPMGSGSVDSGAAPESGAAPLGPTGAVQPPAAWTPPQATTDTAEYVPATSAPPVGPPLIPPLSDTRQSMQAWLAETKIAHAERIRRRRPIKVGVALALAMAWVLVAMLDAFTRVPFPAYLWTGLAVLGAGLLLSLVTRRITLLLLPIAMLAALALVFGGTRASLSDGSGQIGWLPTSVSQLGDHRQFAGQSTLDLTKLDLTKLNVGSTGSGRTAAPVAVHLTQAAGEVRVVLPAKLNATVIADVHMGEIQNGTSHSIGDYVSGANVHLELPAATAVSGQPITIYVDLTAGHVQVDRIS